MNKMKWMIVLIFILSINYSYAQVTIIIKDTIQEKNTTLLKGLRKAEFKDLYPEKPLMLDGVTTPVYSESLTLIEGYEFMKVMMSREYIPNPYIDSNNEVKAFVLRKATALEKSQMIEMKDNIEDKNDLIGKEALPFTATDMAGNNYTLESLKGKVIVINFWFVECKPCVMEMPELNELVEKYKNKDVVFLGFAINDEEKIKKFTKTTIYKYNIIPDSKEAVKTYSVNSFPTHIVIDKESTIKYYTSGLGSTTISDLDNTIKSLTK